MKSNFFLIPCFYFCIGIIFNFLFLKFSQKEIAKWTNENIAKCCSSIEFKWSLLNILFVVYFGYEHSMNIFFLPDEINLIKELFRGLIICSWISVLVVLAKIDLKTNLLPDRLTFTLAIMGIVFSMFYENISWIQSLTSALLAFTFIFLSIFFLCASKSLFQKKRINLKLNLLGEVMYV